MVVPQAVFRRVEMLGKVVRGHSQAAAGNTGVGWVQNTP